MDVWTEQIQVTLGDVDHANRLKPSALFGYFQHATTLHGDRMGIGASQIAESGQAWVLSLMSARILRRPALSETLVLKTWPHGFKKLIALRDYALNAPDGTPVALASSGWLVIDRHKRRPLREESLHVPLPDNGDVPPAIGEGPTRLEPRNDLLPRGERTPAYSDADYNGHVNNVRYVEWAQDCVESAALTGANRIDIDINYVNELRPGSGAVAALYRRRFANRTVIEAYRRDDGQSIFRAEITCN